MKSLFPATDKVGEFHVFDIGGNKLRLIAFVRYRSQKLYIKHVLDHREYDRGKWKEGRDMSVLIKKAAEHWEFVSPLLRKPKNEDDYDMLVQALDELLEMTGMMSRIL